MQLAQPKTLGIFDDHYTGIWDIHTHFNNCCGDENVRLALGEALHFPLLFLRTHAPVDDCDFVLRTRKISQELFVAVLKVFKVQFFTLLNQREYHIDLTALGNFTLHETVEFEPIFFIQMVGLYGLSSRRQLVDGAYVQIPVDAHGQGARDGRGSHHQYVRRMFVFLPKLGALCHPKTVLLVDDGEAEVGKLYRRLNEGMGPDQYGQAAVRKTLVNGGALGGGGAPGEQGDGNACWGTQFLEAFVMLGGQDFCRRHQGRLVPIVNGQ